MVAKNKVLPQWLGYKFKQLFLKGRLKGKWARVSSLFAGLELLLRAVVWCTCPLRYPGTGQTATSAQVSSLSHLMALEPGVLSPVFGV